MTARPPARILGRVRTYDRQAGFQHPRIVGEKNLRFLRREQIEIALPGYRLTGFPQKGQVGGVVKKETPLQVFDKDHVVHGIEHRGPQRPRPPVDPGAQIRLRDAPGVHEVWR